MSVRSLHRASKAAVYVLAVAIAAASPVGGRQRAPKAGPSSAELRAIIENQPDFTADGVVSNVGGAREATAGRVARRGDLYRFDPGAAFFPPKDVEEGEDETLLNLFVPGAYTVIRFDRDPEQMTAFVVRPGDRRYVEISSEGDGVWEIYGLVASYPHVMLLLGAAMDPKKPALEYLGETTIDGHPCVKFRTDVKSPYDRWTYYAAKDLKNLVIRIEWKNPGDGNIQQLFPSEGVTTLRNVKLGAAAELFEPPAKFTKVDRRR